MYSETDGLIELEITLYLKLEYFNSIALTIFALGSVVFAVLQQQTHGHINNRSL